MKRTSLRLNEGEFPGKTLNGLDKTNEACIFLMLSFWWVREVVLLIKLCNLFFSAGDETQVNLAVVQASHRDSGVYRCTITNEYGTDSTDCLLSAESKDFLAQNYTVIEGQ